MRSLTPGAVRDLLAAHHRRPSRALGQNFLADPNVARKIVRLADVGMKEADLERAARIATQAPYPNPRKVEYEPVLALLRDAFRGRL